MRTMDECSRLKQILSLESSNNEAKMVLIERLLLKLDAALKEQQEQRRNLDQKDILIRDFSRELKKTESENKDLKRQMSSDPFVLLLIDGDLSKFKDQYVQNGLQGGEMVAKLLHAATQEYAKTLNGFSPQWKFIVRVYTKLSGLTQCYIKAGIIHDESSLLSFVQGFNAVYELSELVDAGNDKEGADNRIKGNLSIFYNNVHCQHILLAVAGDDSYNSPLRAYTSNDGKNGRITLVQSVPFTSTQRLVASNFNVTKFSRVFRSSKLQLTGRTPMSYTSTTRGPTMAAAQQAVSRTGLCLQAVPVAMADEKMQAAPVSKQRSVIFGFNKHGHRIDTRLQEYNSSLLRSLNSWGLCYGHFLTRCSSSPCRYIHDVNLKENEIETLKMIARLTPCSSLWCQNPLCTSGHRCPYDGNCELQQCTFSPEMHNVDTVVAQVVSVEI